MAELKEFLRGGKFQCTACGACCKSVWPLVGKGFPAQWLNGKGGCKNQMKSGKCRIYERRPEICRLSFTLKGKSDEEIAGLCKTLKEFEDQKT